MAGWIFIDSPWSQGVYRISMINIYVAEKIEKHTLISRLRWIWKIDKVKQIKPLLNLTEGPSKEAFLYV